jgi:hypothetical protein
MHDHKQVVTYLDKNCVNLTSLMLGQLRSVIAFFRNHSVCLMSKIIFYFYLAFQTVFMCEISAFMLNKSTILHIKLFARILLFNKFTPVT